MAVLLAAALDSALCWNAAFVQAGVLQSRMCLITNARCRQRRRTKRLPVLISSSVMGSRHCSGMLKRSRSDGRTPSHLMSGVVRLLLSYDMFMLPARPLAGLAADVPHVLPAAVVMSVQRRPKAQQPGCMTKLC